MFENEASLFSTPEAKLGVATDKAIDYAPLHETVSRAVKYAQALRSKATSLNLLRTSLAGAMIVGNISLDRPTQVSADEDTGEKSRYIVVLKDDVRSSQSSNLRLAQNNGVTPKHVFTSVINGYSGEFSEAKARQIAASPNTKAVVKDQVVQLPEIEGRAVSAAELELTEAPTGVRRVNAHQENSAGKGITVAVLDTGIDLTHPDLAANLASEHKNCVDGKPMSDENGHGTHVAGIIAGVKNGFGVEGVAEESKVAAVKVLDKNGMGYWSDVICGIDWVISKSKTNNIRVINMSLGGPGTSDSNCGFTNNDLLNQATCRARDNNIVNVVAAGNSGKATQFYRPAGYRESVINVSALNDYDGLKSSSTSLYQDTFYWFSNYNADIGAPGGVISTYPITKGGYYYMEGTSMAAPHVAGAAAIYLSRFPQAKLEDVRKYLIRNGETLGNGHADPSGLHPEPVLYIPDNDDTNVYYPWLPAATPTPVSPEPITSVTATPTITITSTPEATPTQTFTTTSTPEPTKTLTPVPTSWRQRIPLVVK